MQNSEKRISSKRVVRTVFSVNFALNYHVVPENYETSASDYSGVT